MDKEILINHIKKLLKNNEYQDGNNKPHNSYEYGLISGYEGALENILDFLNENVTQSDIEIDE